MAWNLQQQYLYHQLRQQQWNSYAATGESIARPNGMWNIMSLIPELLSGANLSHTRPMYPMNGNSSVPHLGSFHTPELNKLADKQTLHISQAEVSPPPSPNDIEEHPYEPPQLPEPSLPLSPLSPPHSPPLDLNDTKYSTPTGPLPTHPPTDPFLQPSLGTTPFPLRHGFTFPQTVQEPHEGQVSPLAAALLNHQMAEDPTRDADGFKLPRWMIKRHTCEICSKKFESRHKLQLHMYSHTGERPHQCETCGMRFARKFCHRRHLKTHTTVKPYNCTRCGRAFRERYDMETHLMTEVCLPKDSTNTEGQSPPTGVEPTYTCKKCKLTFTSCKEFSIHIDLHKPPSITTCHICRAKFSRQEYVKHHIRKEHPDYLEYQKTNPEQLDPQELQFKFREQMSEQECVKHHIRKELPDYLDNQETKTKQLDPQELQIKFREEIEQEYVKHHIRKEYPDYLNNQETKTNKQLDRQALQFKFREQIAEQIAAFKRHQDIVYPDH